MLSSTSEAEVYTVPALIQASLSAIEITNTGVASQTYTLSVVPIAESSSTSTSKNNLIYQKTILPGQTHEIKGGVTLSSGDKVRLSASSNDVVIHVYGSELVSTFNYKILGQIYYGAEIVHHPEIPGDGGYNPGTPAWDESIIAPQVIYTVPTNTQTIITSIFVTNHDVTQRTYDLAVVPAGETLSLKHHLRWDMSVNATDFDLNNAKITMSQGDKIYILPSTVDKIGFTIFGVEK